MVYFERRRGEEPSKSERWIVRKEEGGVAIKVIKRGGSEEPPKPERNQHNQKGKNSERTANIVIDEHFILWKNVGVANNHDSVCLYNQ